MSCYILNNPAKNPYALDIICQIETFKRGLYYG